MGVITYACGASIQDKPFLKEAQRKHIVSYGKVNGSYLLPQTINLASHNATAHTTKPPWLRPISFEQSYANVHRHLISGLAPALMLGVIRHGS